MAELTAVIVTWNSASEVEAAVRSARKQGVPAVVVDNDSADDSADVARRAGADIVVETGANLGFGAASNRGLQHVSTPYVMFLNPDARLGPGAAAALIRFLADHPSAAIVGPAVTDEQGHRTRSAGRRWNLATELANKTLLHRLIRAPRSTRRVAWVTGAALAARTSVVRDLGGFDPALFLYYEDLDLCRRARSAGHEVWFTDAADVVHLGQRSSRQVEEKVLLHSQDSAEHYWRAHGGSARLLLFRVLTIPEMLLRSLLWTALGAIPGKRPLARARLRAYHRILTGEFRHRTDGPPIVATGADSAATVSVVITTYNRGDVVGRAIDSALAQSYKPMEVVVVDDGSTDETASTLTQYGERIRVVTQENRERGAARNAGLRHATGELICFLDSDDELLPGHISLLAATLAIDPACGLAYGPSEFFDEENDHVFDVFPRRPVEGDAHLACATGNRMTIGSVLVRRSLLDRVGWFDEERELAGGEDWELWTRCLAATRIVFVPQARVRIRFHSRNTVGNPEAMERAYRSAVKKILEHPLNRERLAPHRRRIRAGLFALLAHHHMLDGHAQTARARLLEGFRENPRMAFTWVWSSMLVKTLVGSRLIRLLRVMRRGTHLRAQADRDARMAA